MPRQPKLPENLYRRNGIIYYRFRIKKIRFEGSCFTKDAADAMRVLEQEREKAWQQVTFGKTEKKRIKFSDAFKIHFRNRWKNSLQSEWYETTKDTVIATVGDFYLDEVKNNWCGDYIDARRQRGNLTATKAWKPVSKYTINSGLKIVRTVLRNTNSAEYQLPPTVKNPNGNGDDIYQIYLLPMTQVERERNTPLQNEEELKRLIKETAKHAVPIILVDVGTGMRKQSLLDLNIENLHWNERTIEFVQKGGKPHHVAMTDQVYNILRRCCDGRTSGPVFLYGQNNCDCVSCREWNKPKKLTGKHVRCIETGEVFTSIANAARSIDPKGTLAPSIGDVCNGNSKANGKSGKDYPVMTAGGYHWEFVDRVSPKPKKNKARRTGRIKSIDYTFNKARLAIERGDLRFHDLRHTLGTWMGRRGQNAFAIKDALGHSDIRTTQRYVHVDLNSTRIAMEVVELPDELDEAA